MGRHLEMHPLTRASALGLALVKPVLSMAGWWTWSPHALTPHFAFQDAGSGDLLHSACNSNGTAIFPTHQPYKFSVAHQPKPATGLAISGWWDDDLQTNIASIFYQGLDGSLINAFFHCDYTTGAYETTADGEWKLSDAIGDFSVHEKTGLSVVELGDAGGSRVFYHNEEQQVSLLAYDDDTDWLYLGPVSKKSTAGKSITAVQTDGVNVSVAFPYDDENIAIAQFREGKKDKWVLASFPTPFSSPAPTNRTEPLDITLASPIAPFSLPGYDKAAVHLRLAADEDANLSTFYIGKDRKLHQVSQDGEAWAIMQENWPEADEEFAPLALVSPLQSNEVWIYYRSSEGDILELHQQDGSWMDPKKPLTRNETLVDEHGDASDGDKPSNEGNPTDTNTSGDVGGDLSIGAKAGLGVGIGVGVSVLLLVAAILFRKHRSARESKADDQTSGLDGENMSSHSYYHQAQHNIGGYSAIGSDQASSSTPQELLSVPKYELLGDTEHRRSDQCGDGETSSRACRVQTRID